MTNPQIFHVGYWILDTLAKQRHDLGNQGYFNLKVRLHPYQMQALMEYASQSFMSFGGPNTKPTIMGMGVEEDGYCPFPTVEVIDD